jgi:hypothetical protein
MMRPSPIIKFDMLYIVYIIAAVWMNATLASRSSTLAWPTI